MARCSCQKKSKISGTMKGKNAQIIGTVLYGTVGFAGAKFLNKVAFIRNNPMIGSIAKVGAGILVAGMSKQKITQQIAQGMMLAGGTELVGQFVPAGTIPGMGYLPAAQSTAVHSVAGMRGIAHHPNYNRIGMMVD